MTALWWLEDDYKRKPTKTRANRLIAALHEELETRCTRGELDSLFSDLRETEKDWQRELDSNNDLQKELETIREELKCLKKNSTK